MLADLRPKGLTGKLAEASLERAFITCNKNAVPFDPQKPFVTSGIRLGTPAATTRGFGPAEWQDVGAWIGEVLTALAASPDDNGAVEAEVRDKVQNLCRRFPIYPSDEK
jgi:glycine hydroxymethyltransferase